MDIFVILKERFEDEEHEWVINIFSIDEGDSFFEHVDCELFNTEKERDDEYLNMVGEGFLSLKEYKGN
jgi:hypothetical protein